MHHKIEHTHQMKMTVIKQKEETFPRTGSNNISEVGFKERNRFMTSVQQNNMPHTGAG